MGNQSGQGRECCRKGRGQGQGRGMGQGRGQGRGFGKCVGAANTGNNE